MSKVWITSEYYFPDLTSSGYYLTHIAERFGTGYEVEVICATPLEREGVRVKSEVRNGVKVKRIDWDNLNKDKLASRVFRFFVISFSFLNTLLFKVRRGDVLVIVTNPAPMIVIGALIKVIKRSKLVILVHDVFPENLVATKLIDQRSFIYRTVLRVFNHFYKKADELIVCGRDMAELFEAKLSGFSGKVTYIPNWGDPDTIFPAPECGVPIREKYGLSDKMVFQFAGNLGRAQGINFMISAFQSVEFSDVVLQFFGKGVFKEEIEEIAKAESNNISYGGVFERSESNKYLNACDVAVISLEQGMKGLGVPSKLYNILSAGKPILYIGDSEGEVALVVSKNSLGVVCKPGDSESIVEAINYFKNMSESELQAISQRARNLSVETLSMGAILNQYDSVMASHVQ